ncbi:imidazolonepropionase [Devosia lacusdianchii]|uniref:imidazolonepropionase n=1 Tax=Devosia lacusdianchii TaxID=2917991 RepID=UPI001F067B3B|nr:imidazolonepropionase [Devosia sp. JXJ CY 41]
MKRLWTNARIATMAPDLPGIGIIEGGAILAEGDRIVWVGHHNDLPTIANGAECMDLDGRWITPGLIDCHTHLVHGGDRAREFEMRLAGATYEEIARAGGGIIASVQATRQSSLDDLVATALPRLDRLVAEGVTTIEIKSGYGLDLASELTMLRAARALDKHRAISVVTTCLSAHAVPPEFKHDRAGYLDLVVDTILPAMAAEGLADAVDAFMEGIAFSGPETARVFDKARALGLPIKLHADQLSNLHGAQLAAEFGALSVDHLEYTDEDGVAAMARAGSVAVLLPGAFYTLGETQLPPIDFFRRYNVPMAVATDANPGTSPMTSLLLAMNMAATLFGLRIDEVLAGTTREAARALGKLNETGTIEAGKYCDLAIWDIERPAELVYRLGFNPLHRRVWRNR